MPETEWAAFRQVWPENRQGLVVAIRQAVGSVRHFVRVVDEMGNCIAVGVPRRPSNDTDQAHARPEDRLLTAVEQRARAVFEKLENAGKARGEAH
jgi:hypothetical protein